MDSLKEKRFDFLGLKFNNCTTAQAIKKIEHFISIKEPHMVSTIAAELVVLANESQRLREIYNSADLLTMDSFVLYYAARLFRKPVKEPVNATRLVFDFLKVAQNKPYRLYFLGAEEDILFKAVKNLKAQYPGINIVGYHHGYFDFENDKDVIYDIKEKKPDILLVAMSSPLKENFVSKNLDKMNVPVCIGVGGCVDVIAGKCQLAPFWVSKLGLEWFYRFIQEPKRMWKRYTVINIKFLGLLVKEIFLRKCGDKESACSSKSF